MTQATKTSRNNRASATRKKVWEPTSRLDIPKEHKQKGMEYIWVRHELLNNPDDSNVHERLREGYEPVKPDELGLDYHADVMSAGKHAGTVRAGDLILMKNSKDIVAQKQAYYDNQTERMGQAYSREYQNAGTSAMPTQDESKTTVTKGGPRGTPKFEE
tara:strand:+ start:289 stop:765 length:477 start_codon:yes stop_codon:yes gene_type:complete